MQGRRQGVCLGGGGGGANLPKFPATAARAKNFFEKVAQHNSLSLFLFSCIIFKKIVSDFATFQGISIDNEKMSAFPHYRSTKDPQKMSQI